MEQKKEPIKISLPIFISILVLLVAIIFGSYMFMQNQKLEKEISRLREDIKTYQATKNEPQEKLNTKTETANSSNETSQISTNQNQTVSFTDEQVKTVLEDYLELGAHAGCDSLLEYLTEKGNLNYNPSKDNVLNDGTVITTIKFSDYKNAMLNYVSEEEFEKNWHTTQYFNKNSDGYLTKFQGGGNIRVYTIKNITKTNNSTYSAKATSVVDDNEYFEENDFTFTVKSYNGKCVIDSITE